VNVDNPRRHLILLTGRPGSGKTTVVRRLAELLASRTLAGFYTEEIRVAGQRQGFAIRTFSGTTGTLAHTRTCGPYRVGRYGIDVAAFERVVLPELARPAGVLLIDEIGKMECFSAPFVQAVRDLLDGPAPIVATVALHGTGLIADVKRRPDAKLLKVTPGTRDALPAQLVQRIARPPPSGYHHDLQ
jgi:nucleoside-triphosphatase